MNINIFDDPSQVPQPRNNIKIEEVKINPYPDGRRVFVEVRVTTFQERPNLMLFMLDQDGKVVNEVSIIATMHAKMEFTLHMKMPEPAGEYTLIVELFYESRNPPLDKHEVEFNLQANA